MFILIAQVFTKIISKNYIKFNIHFKRLESVCIILHTRSRNVIVLMKSLKWIYVLSKLVYPIVHFACDSVKLTLMMYFLLDVVFNVKFHFTTQSFNYLKNWWFLLVGYFYVFHVLEFFLAYSKVKLDHINAYLMSNSNMNCAI